MIVIIAMDANGKPVGMIAKQRYGLRLTAVVIPWDECNGRMKIVLLRLLEEAGIIKIPVCVS